MTLPTIRRFAGPAALAVGTADLVVERLRAAIAERGHASIALAGGTTPQPFHRELTTRALDWSRVHVYFGDDRCVPPDHPASNYRAARETLLAHVPLLAENIHRIEGELPVAEAAARYADVVRPALPLDVCILGMGDDGHTASLFPATPPAPPDALVIATTSPVPPHERVTFTFGAIRASREVILQVTGGSKAARLAQVYAELAANHPVLPTAQVGPAIWMVDDAAAAQLPA